MKKSLYLLILFVPFFLVSCKKDKVSGSGAIITEPRSVDNFYNVSVNGSTNVFITRGDLFEVKVKAYENIVPYLETKVKNGTLEIGFKENSNISNDNSEVYITMPALNSVTTSGSGNITTTGTFLSMDYFTAGTSGSGNISIEKGMANNCKLNIAGSGKISSFGLETKQATVSISGSGSAELTVTEKLNVTISGSGNVYYKGSPAVDTKISGSGAVIQK